MASGTNQKENSRLLIQAENLRDEEQNVGGRSQAPERDRHAF